jgi:hypothetical protein
LHLHNHILRFPSPKATAPKYSKYAYFLSIAAKIAIFFGQPPDCGFSLEALRSGKTINQVGQEFDVHPVQWPWPKSAASLPAINRQLVARCEHRLRV